MEWSKLKMEESMSVIKGWKVKLTLTKERNCVTITPFLSNGALQILKWEESIMNI